MTFDKNVRLATGLQFFRNSASSPGFLIMGTITEDLQEREKTPDVRDRYTMCRITPIIKETGDINSLVRKGSKTHAILFITKIIFNNSTLVSGTK